MYHQTLIALRYRESSDATAMHNACVAVSLHLVCSRKFK